MPNRHVVLALLPLAVAIAACAPPAPSGQGDVVRVVSDPASDASVRDKDIAFFERRLAEDPESAADRSRLARLLLARARESGNVLDMERAELLALESLKARESHNEGTYSILASARLAVHDFTGALTAAQRLVALNHESPTARALLGETLLEIGRYDEAATLFTSVEAHTSLLPVASRLARWYELTGRLPQARNVARYAAKRSRTDGGLSREQIAWFHLRAGDMALKGGALREADSLYALGLSVLPGDYRILAARARLAFLQGDWRGAIAAGEQSIAVQLDPGTLGVLADAWEASGDTSQSASYARAMTASALTQPGAIHRGWGLYLIDHGQRTDEVLRRVRNELRTRKDVYGHDLLAWTLHARGDQAGAWRAMQRALAQGTQDAQLAYHASEIARALGDTAEAIRQTQRMLAINPAYRAPARVESVTVRAASVPSVAGR